jgi:NAD(P)-dependent dehydrogenase (short-subunit alcohol dehydrogenase family)
MNTLVLGAQGPLGLAIARQVLQTGASVVAAVQAPHRAPPALHDMREEFPAQLISASWHAHRLPALPPVERAFIAELPIPPAQADENDEPTADLRALSPDRLHHHLQAILGPTLAALQLVAHIRPKRVLIQASWLGSVQEKIRGGDYALSTSYAAQLMLVRTASLDLTRAGIATVIGNAGRYRLDMAGPGFHADIDEVARGLMTVLDACTLGAEPEYRDWRGTLRQW